MSSNICKVHLMNYNYNLNEAYIFKGNCERKFPIFQAS